MSTRSRIGVLLCFPAMEYGAAFKDVHKASFVLNKSYTMMHFIFFQEERIVYRGAKWLF